MKSLILGILFIFTLNIFSSLSMYSQTATTTVNYSGFQACGGCAVCGDDYWCTNTPGSYCGNTAPCMSKTFFDPVPAGHVVTSVSVAFYTGSCEGAAFVSSINGFALPMAYDGNTGCLCSDDPCVITTTVSSSYPCGMPGYIYGGTNTFYLCSYAPMCINKAVLTFTYVDPDVITPAITASGPLSFCEGGSVSLDAGSGYSSYAWNTGASTQTISVNSTGTYSVTVASTTGCTTGSSSVNVTEQAYSTPTFAQLGPYCVGESPGALPSTSQNGIAGTWSPSTINTSTSGNTVYTFSANAGQCANGTTMSVTVNPSPVTTFDPIGPYCVGETPDALPTTSTNGVPGTWSPATINTSTPGTSSYTFTPSVACASPATVAITINENPTANAAIHGNPSCNGLSDGSIVLGVTGGTTPYTYLWNNGEITQNLLDIPAGYYSVIVTDINGCTATSSASLTEPDPITGTVSSSTNAICNTPGAATVQGNGGTPAYTYIWPATAGGVSGNTANALLAGSYQVTITDIYNCLGTVDVSIAQTGGISASVTNVTEALCAGSNNGTITLSISGGAPNYQIDWGTNNATSANSSYTITDLGAGTYSIDITDANGCVFTLNNVEVTEPQAMTIDVINIVNVECNGGATGSAEIEINGGTAPHTISYSVPGISTEIINNLSAGTYGVTVTDNNGCTAETTFDIGETDQITVNETTADANCYGEQGNATIEVSSGGTSPFSIIWDDGVELFQHNAVPAATLFGYTITDSNGCSYQSNITISQPELLEVSLTGTNLQCFNNGSGVASVAVTGGTMPYFYEWNNGILNPSISYLDAGTYSVTVTDFNECTASGSVNISEPEEIIIEVSTENLICGSQQGSADITISGGTLPYQTLWSTGDTLSNIDNLYANMYSVTVSDQNNCSVSTDFAIERIGEINAGIELVEGIDCYGESSGILSANSSNGATPFSYSWSNNQSSPSITSIPAGNYFVTLTDSWGCTGTDQYEITQPQNITVEAIIDDVNCEGGSDGSIVLNLSGGSAPFMIEWSNNQITQAINNLSSGTYSVTITDSHYCEITQSFILDEPEVNLMITASVKDIDCNGQSNGEIAMQATGGTSPYTYTCSFNDFDYEGQIATGLPSGVFEIMVTDNMGCIATGTVTVSEPTPIETSYISIRPSCIGNNDGYIEFTTNGGTAPYIYEWQNGTTELPYINNLMQGDYFITITDTKQCVLEIGPIILSDIEVLCLNIPNAITPNSDGVNDTWVIEGIDAYPEYVIQVFNRWGQLLYNGIPGSPKWDGTTLQGKAVPTGCYVYVINLFDGTPPITGNISVVY